MLSQVKVLAFGLALCMVQGAMAQGFNKRYDAFGQGYEQGAWGIERSGENWTVFSFSYEPDTIVPPDSVIGSYRIIMERIDMQGNLLWEKRHKVPRNSIFLGWADCCDSVVGGGFVTAGSFAGLDIPDARTQVRLMRYNADGDTLWTRTFGDSTHYWVGQQVKQTADGGFLIVGYTDATGYEDGMVIKTDPLGNEQWRHTYGLGGIVIDGFISSVQLGNGYIITGMSYPQMDNSEMLAVKVDATGNEIWTRRWGGSFDDAAAFAGLCSDGNVVVASAIGYADDGESLNPYLAKLDTLNGATIWEREYGLPSYSKFLFAAKELPNTDLIACGVTYDGGQEQGLLLRTTANGDSLWMRNYAYHDNVIDQGQGRFWDVLPTADGGCIASGFANNPFNGPYPPGYSQDAWVVKVDSMGCIVPGCDGVGITEQVTNLAGALKLWPNPVQDQLHVGIHLPENLASTGPLTLSITTLEGKLVLRQQVPTSIANEAEVDVSRLASGTYALHLSDGTRWLAGSKFVVQ